MFKRVEKYKWRWTRTLGRHRVLADSRLDNEQFLFGFRSYNLVNCHWLWAFIGDLVTLCVLVCYKRADYIQ